MKDEYDRAIEDYNAAIGLNENDPYSYYSRGWAHLLQGNMSKARADFNKALDLGHDGDEVEAALSELKKLEDNR